MKKLLLPLSILLSLVSLKASAQNDGISQLLKTSPGDASKLLNAYADPLFKGLGTGLNNGWTNTAKTRSLLHFDLRVSASALIVPAAEKNFDVTALGLSNNIRLHPGSPAKTPTIANGNNSATSSLDIYTDGGTKVDEFKLPEGLSSYVYAPQIQLTAGLIRNTDLTIRYIPDYKLPNDYGKIGMVGFGLKHDIMSDLFGSIAGKIIPFNLAVAAGYTRFNYEKSLEVRPSSGKTPDAASAGRTDFSNQRLDGHFSGFNIQAIISKKLMFFTPFAAVGYNTAKTNVGLLGNYPVSNSLTTYTVYTDPVSVNKNSVSDLKVDAGFQLEFSIVRIYASGSLAKYKSATVGLGLGI